LTEQPRNPAEKKQLKDAEPQFRPVHSEGSRHELLEYHCKKLEVVEDNLYELLSQETDSDRAIKLYELWLIAQSQLRLTASAFDSKGSSNRQFREQLKRK
jgi:hypothetical protein